jgi:hypothetical protein
MERQELIRAMQQANNGAGLLTIKQIAQFRGEHINTTAKFLKGLEYLPSGKKKLYYVGDVASRIMEKRNIT